MPSIASTSHRQVERTRRARSAHLDRLRTDAAQTLAGPVETRQATEEDLTALAQRRQAWARKHSRRQNSPFRRTGDV